MSIYEKGSFTVIPNKDLLRGKKGGVQSVYFWICDHADEHGLCWPSRQTIADDAGVSLRVIDEYISELIEIGVIKKTSQKRGKENISNLYQVLIPEVVANLPLPSSKSAITPSSKSAPVTVPMYNSTQEDMASPTFLKEKTEELEMYLNFPFPVVEGISEETRDDGEGYVQCWLERNGKRLRQSEINTLEREHKTRTRIEKPKMIPPSVGDAKLFIEVYKEECKKKTGVSPICTSEDQIVIARTIKKYGLIPLGKVASWYLSSLAKDKDKMNIKNIVWSKTLNDYQSETGIQL